MDNQPLPSGTDYADFLRNQIKQITDEESVNLSEYKYIFDDINKIRKQTNAQYEIFINMTANIMENIEGSEFPEHRNVYANNYFIPVPSGNDHNEYVKIFFNYLENCMLTSAEKAEVNGSKYN